MCLGHACQILWEEEKLTASRTGAHVCLRGFNGQHTFRQKQATRSTGHTCPTPSPKRGLLTLSLSLTPRSQDLKYLQSRRIKNKGRCDIVRISFQLNGHHTANIDTHANKPGPTGKVLEHLLYHTFVFVKYKLLLRRRARP